MEEQTTNLSNGAIILQEQQHIQEYSKNSLTAKSGFKAEDIFRTDEIIKPLRYKNYYKNLKINIKVLI